MRRHNALPDSGKWPNLAFPVIVGFRAVSVGERRNGAILHSEGDRQQPSAYSPSTLLRFWGTRLRLPKAVEAVGKLVKLPFPSKKSGLGPSGLLIPQHRQRC